MTFLPIVERELRLKARRSRTHWLRCGMVLAFAVLSFGILAVDWSTGRNPTEMGQHLFWALSGLAFASALLAGPVVTADCLSEEKREGTLGLLFLTHLKGHDVVLGKLFATSLPVFYSFVAGVPVLAVPFFLGGVTAGEFWRMTLVLLTTLLFSLATGLLVSALSRNGRRAFLTTGFIVALAAASPLVWGYAIAKTLTLSIALVPSPTHALILVFENRFLAASGGFWQSWFGLLLFCIGLLALASVLLPRAWQERPDESRLKRVLDKSWLGQRVVCSRSARQREKLLGKNPVLWLAERTALNPVAVGVFWWGCLGLWVTGLLELRKISVPPEALFLTVYALHAAMKCWVAWEAGRRFAEDRRSGALELLLVTPLSERAILAGWLTGLKRRFAGPVAMLLSLDFLLWWAGADGGWLLAMLVATGLFMADCYTLCWVGLWKGLTARSSTRAYVETLSRVLVLPWLTFFGAVGISGLVFDLTDLPSAFGWLVFLWFVIGYVLDFAFCLWSIHKLSQDLRLVAAQQFEPRRRRFSRWLPFKPKTAPARDERLQSLAA